MPKNEKCLVSDSVLCRWIGKDCKDCYVSGMKEESDAKKVLEDFEVTLSLLPEDFDSLQSDTCGFCKDEARPRACYAVIDLAHRDPEHKRGAIFGLGKKVRQRIGSMFPVSISICKQCRQSFRIAETLKWVMLLIFGGIAMGLCFIPEINSNQVMPYVVILVGLLIGYVTGKILSAAYVNKKSAKTWFNVFDIPVCAKMREAGWFTIQDEGSVTRFIFAKKPMVKKLSDFDIKPGKTPENI